MKLYATVASERASKGQGGNKYLEMSLLVGNTKEPRKVVTIKAKVYQDENGLDCYAIYGEWEGAREGEKMLKTGFLN